MSCPLTDLRPKWLHMDRDNAPGIHVGIEFDCPRCSALANARAHRLSLWFVATRSSEDMTLSKERPRLFDHAGNRFDELTIWSEKPPPRDPLIQFDHWTGYIEAGHVYDLPKIGGAP